METKITRHEDEILITLTHNNVEFSFDRQVCDGVQEYYVSFKVKGKIYEFNLSRQEKLQAVKDALYIWSHHKELLSDEMPTLFYCDVFDCDGAGDKRAKAYRKLGFEMIHECLYVLSYDLIK